MLRDTLKSFRKAFGLWLPLLSAHLFIRLVTAAVLVPVVGVLLAAWLSISDQSALTDQDIARFLFTPAGAIGGLAIVSLAIVAAVLDVAVMTALLHQDDHNALRSLQTAADFTLSALPRLVRFALGLLVRILLVAAPFVLVAAVIAWVLLREYDINFYLTHRPPAFIAAAGLIGLVALAMCALLLQRLTGWAIALHLSVLDFMPVRQAFEMSRIGMTGYRLDLLGRLFWWFVLRLAAAAAIGVLAGSIVAQLQNLFGDLLQLIIVGLIAISILWAVTSAVLSALANGALADLLNDQFMRVLQGRSAAAILSARGGSRALLAPANLVLAVTALLSVASVASGGLLLESIGAKEEVAVIAHRGAAGSRPENTMASVVKAIEDGADWIEIDVQETADGEVVVAHDSDFMKSSGVPTKVWDANAADIAAIDIGSWFDPSYADERAPFLRDVLAAAKGRAKVIIELKYYGHDVDLENRVIGLVEEAGMEDQVATMSLKYPAVRKMRQLRPEWRTGVLAATAVGDLAGLDGDFLAVNTGQASARLASRADAAGKDVYVWTVNDPATMSRMISLGADGLITDDPALALEVIEYHAALPTSGRFLLALGDRVGAIFDLGPSEELRP